MKTTYKWIVFLLISFSSHKAIGTPSEHLQIEFEEFSGKLFKKGDSLQSLINSPIISEPPIKITWTLLQNIEFDLTYIPEIEMSMYTPLFSEAVKALDGKEVIIEGYVIPMYEEGNEVALSANSYASCFFCGQAGPASVMSIFLRKKAGRFKVDDIRTFRGKLKLNYDNPDEFYYSLQDANLE